MRSLIVFIIILCFGIISGCDHTSSKSAEQLISEKEKPYLIHSDKPIEFSPVQPVVYQGAHLRDPFEIPEATYTTKKYANTVLKTYSLDSLKLIGIVHHPEKQWAIFRTSRGKTYRLFVGSRVGIQNALITHISENEVKFTEEVGTSTGTQVREIVMRVQVTESDLEKE